MRHAAINGSNAKLEFRHLSRKDPILVRVHQVESVSRLPRQLADPLYEKIVLWNDGTGLSALDFQGFSNRHALLFQLLSDVEPSANYLPPTLFHTGDRPIGHAGEVLSFSERRGLADIGVPDFMFQQPLAPSVGWDELARDLAAAGSVPSETDLLGWMGNPARIPARYRLLTWGQKHAERAEFWATGAYYPRWSPRRRLSPVARRRAHQGMDILNQVRRFRYLIDVEGRGYSGRVKLLLHSGRPLFIAKRPWNEWWFTELEPFKEYIPVRRDLADLVEQLNWADSHPREALEIARRAQDFAQRILTRASVLRRWHDVLNTRAASSLGESQAIQRMALPRSAKRRVAELVRCTE
ncbi:glycosyl transferase family 90 [Nocardioides sp. DS6]|uniref:Glycosyl transferase family 90 n=1 Tax=Nocardioides eburneus TaxID=3231482 RepID=A0ABV3SWG9_9ACTN